jgi:hypothetical protein
MIKDVTICCIDCKNHLSAVRAMRKSLEHLQFEKVLFLTDMPFTSPGIDVVEIPKIKSVIDYSHFIFKQLGDYIDTQHVLIIQHDGYIINPYKWKEEWKTYDYIGAPWWYAHNNVGNGGFSLRSSKLLRVLKSPLFNQTHPEDDKIGRSYRQQLERVYKIKFAPEEVAAEFSWEPNAKYRLPVTDKPFGFHGIPDMILKAYLI